MNRLTLACVLGLVFGMVIQDAAGQRRFRLDRIAMGLAEASDLTSGTPTMGTCGSSPSVSGTNSNGTIAVGSGVVTSCAMNFSTTLGAAPTCTVTPSLALAVGLATSTTALTIAIITSLGDGKLFYHCRIP